MSFEQDKLLVWCPIECNWRRVLSLTVQDGHFYNVTLADDSYSIGYDGGNRYLFPGLIDSHVHIAEDPNRTANGSCERSAISTETLQQTFMRVLRNLRVSLRAGITTLRDMGNLKDISLDIVELLNEEREAGVLLPRVFTAGGFLARRGGHAFDRGIDTPDQESLIGTIRHLAQEGASFIKIMNDPIVFDSSDLRQARVVTSELGIPLVVHTYTEKAARLAMDAQVDVLEHAGAYSDATMDMIKGNGAFVVSTFVAALDTVVDPVGCAANTLFPDADLTIFRNWYETCCDSIPRLYRKGVRLLCGTDAGFPGTDFDSLSRELAALEMLGVPFSESIKSATIYGARALRCESLLGEIREGAWADYLVFNTNPLIGNRRLQHPDEVFCGGERAV